MDKAIFLGFYVYVAFRPWDGSPCYVGKGSGNRWQKFTPSARNNRHLQRIIAKAMRLGLEVPVIKVRENLTEAEAFQTERAFIAAIGRGKYGPLVNMTDGGEGATGYIPTLAARRHHAAVLRGRPALNKGVAQSDDQRQKIQEFWTDEQRAEASEYWRSRGHRPSSDACVKGGYGKRGIKTGPNKSRGVPKAPDHRAAISASRKNKPHPHKGVPRSPECRAKISETKRLRRLMASAVLEGANP